MSEDSFQATAIKRPGIKELTLQRCGIRLVDEPEPGSIEIPFFDIEGTGTGFKRWRLPKARANGQKYHQPSGSGVQAYFPPLGVVPVNDLVIVEGEFKSISLVEAGIAAIGLPSFGTYTRDGENEPELLLGIQKAIERWKPARILFLGDSDTATNFGFARNAVVLAERVAPVPVLLPRIPLSGPGKGIDDCRENLGVEFPAFWQQIVTTSECVDPGTGAGLLALRLLEREREAIVASTGTERGKHEHRLIRMVAECGGDPFAAEKLLRLSADILSVGTRAISQAVKQERERLRKAMRAANPRTAESWPAEFRNVEQKFGPPAYVEQNEDGNIRGKQINQAFWAGLYHAQNNVLYDAVERRFYQYEAATGVWKSESEAAIEQRISTLLLNAAREHPSSLGFLEQHRSLRLLQAILGHLRSVAERYNPFSRARRYIHSANQMIEFDDADGMAVCKPFSPEFYSRNALPVAFDQKAQCPRFLHELLLPSVSAEDATLIQRWFGSAILQHNLPQRFLVLDGEPGRGKSQLSVLARLLVGELNTGELRTTHLNERFELFRIARKTLLIGADAPGDFLMQRDASRLKALVGGDPLEAEAKNSNESFTLYGNFNVLITCNEPLSVRLESDAGAWRRRLLIVRFMAPAPQRKIPDFARLLYETEGPGILGWAIQGAVQLLHEVATTGDYILTKLQSERIDGLLAESSSLEIFVRDQLVRSESGNVSTKEIEEAYAAYCDEHGFRPLTKRMQQSQIPELMLRFHHVSDSNSIPRQSPAGPTKHQRGYRRVRLRQVSP